MSDNYLVNTTPKTNDHEIRGNIKAYSVMLLTASETQPADRKNTLRNES
jgi:hypothetical protein